MFCIDLTHGLHHFRDYCIFYTPLILIRRVWDHTHRIPQFGMAYACRILGSQDTVMCPFPHSGAQSTNVTDITDVIYVTCMLSLEGYLCLDTTDSQAQSENIWVRRWELCYTETAQADKNYNRSKWYTDADLFLSYPFIFIFLDWMHEIHGMTYYHAVYDTVFWPKLKFEQFSNYDVLVLKIVVTVCLYWTHNFIS